MNNIDVILVRYCPNGIHNDLWEYTVSVLEQYPVNILIRDNSNDNIGLVKARIELLKQSQAPVVVLMDFDFRHISIDFPAMAQRLDVAGIGMTIPCSHHAPRSQSKNEDPRSWISHYPSALPSKKKDFESVSKLPCNCMVMKRKLLDNIGGLYEGYHTSHGDVEICQKIINRGLRIEQYNKSKVIHVGGSAASNPNKVSIWEADRKVFDSRKGKFKCR